MRLRWNYETLGKRIREEHSQLDRIEAKLDKALVLLQQGFPKKRETFGDRNPCVVCPRFGEAACCVGQVARPKTSGRMPRVGPQSPGSGSRPKKSIMSNRPIWG